MEYTIPFSSSLSPEDLLLSFYGCLENSDDGFLVVEPSGTIAYINDAYCNYIGVKQADVIGKPVKDYIPTSQLLKISNDPDFGYEVGTIHRVSNNQYTDHEQYVVVNRTNVSRGGVSVSGVGQIKFVRNTLRLSNMLTSMMDKLSLYEQELKRLSSERYSINQILGKSPAIQAAKSMIIKSAGTDFAVMLTGETGTGKEVFANAIHYASSRKNKPIIQINCAAIPAELFESELFGYEEGAFTGAKRGGKKGLFELADHGTLFLDEIGEMPLNLQAKLLRAIQEGEIKHVGGTRQIPVDVRIICATNKNLKKEVRENRFREDLYFRLNVISIELPPLRKRTGDAEIFADNFLQELNEKYHSNVQLSPYARTQLRNYQYPGNVRELKNIIERSYVLQENGVIHTAEIPSGNDTLFQKIINTSSGSLESILDSVERQVLLEAIQENDGNLRQTAMQLGINRVTLYRKMEKHQITREDVQ